MGNRQLITEAEVRLAARQGDSTLKVSPDAIITPLALDAAHAVGIRFEIVQPNDQAQKGKSVALAITQAGFHLKRAVLDILHARKIEVVDVRTDGNDEISVAIGVVKAIIGGQSSVGIIIDSTGMQTCMIANRFRDIRAVNIVEGRHGKLARIRYNANLVTLGGEFLTPRRACDIIEAFIDTQYLETSAQTR